MEPSAAALPLPGGVEEPPQHDVQHDVPPAGAEQPAAEQPGHAASMAADGGRLPPLHGQRSFDGHERPDRSEQSPASASWLERGAAHQASDRAPSPSALGREALMRGGSQQGFQGSRGGHARKLAAQKEGEQGADKFWRAVLKDLNLWNKRAVARKEEHYQNRSLLCLDNTNWFRQQMIMWIDWPWFDRIILILIILNCCSSVGPNPLHTCRVLTKSPSGVETSWDFVHILLDGDFFEDSLCEVCGLTNMKCGQALEDGICHCPGRECTELELYKRLLYAGHDCDLWYPEALKKTISDLDTFFLAAFTIELACKVAARGLILHQHAYLREASNWLDFVVVMSGLATEIADKLNVDNLQSVDVFSVLRLVRVFRPLRTMTKIRGMKTLIVTVGRSLKALSEVLMLLLFLLLIFGILSVDMFSGYLRKRCFVDPNQNFTPAVKSRLESQQYPYLASNTVNEYGWNADVQICFGGCDPVVLDGSQYNATCSDHPFCASADDDGNLIWKKCPDDWMLNPMDMGEGYMNYDNILSSIWLLLCHITLEGWSGTMYDMGVDGGVQMWTSRVFHLLWVLIGAVFLIQLMTAIIASKYFAAKEEELTLRARIALDEEAILQTAQVIASKQAPERPLKRSAILMETASKFTAGDAIQRAKQVAKKLYDSIPGFKLMYTFVADTLFRIRICCRIVVKHRLCQPFILACIVLNTICMVIEFHDQDKFETSLCEQRCKLDASLPANATCTGPLFNRTLDLDAHGKRVRPAQNSFCFLESNLAIADSVVCSNLQTAADCYASDSNCFWVPEKKGIFGFGDEGYKSCKLGLYSADSFGVGALSLRQLCGDDDPTIQCPAFDPNTSKVLTLINLVLTIIFIAEMVLKMLGMGLFAPVVQQDGDASSFRQGTLKHLSMDPMLPDRQTSIFRAGTGLQGPDRQDSIFRAGTGLQGPGRTGSGSNEGTGGSRTIFRDRTRRPNLIRGNTFRDKYAHVEFEGYFEDSWNCFDFLIVCFSIVELISTATSEGQTSNGLFSVLRTMRLFRLFKLFRNWHEMRKIVGTLGTAMRSLQLVLFLYCLVAYIFALLAMNLFAREFKFVKTANPRSNFDLFSTSFFTVFQIVTTENWTTVAYNCITARGVLGGIFPFIIVFVGNYIIMNLFVAILLSKMTDEEVDHTLQLVNEAEQEHEQPGETNARLDSRRNLMPQNTGLTAESSGILTVAASFRQTFRQSMARVLPDAKNNTVQEPRANHFSASQGSQGPQFALGGAMAILKLDKDDVDVDIMAVELKDTFLKHFMAVKNKHGIHRRIRLPAHNALCLFSPRNPLRVLMAYISHNPWFDKVIIGCILVSSVLLMVEAFDPRSETRATRCDTSGLDCRYRLPGQVSFPSADEDYVCPVRRDEDGFDTKFGPCGSADEAPCCADVRLHAALSQMDNVFTAIFLLEMIIKLISEGVLFHKLAYLRSWWNVLDAGVVIISVLTFVLKLTGSTIDLKMLKALRTFRVLRPLRIVKRNPQLKTTVTCIISSIPAMLTVAVVLLLYLFVIGMFFSNIYKGRFFRCYDPQDQIYYGSSIYPLGNLYTADQALSGPTSVPTIIECVTKTQGLGVWQDAPTSFNTISTALQTLFEMATTEGWLQVMGSMTDATGVGITPQPDLNLHLAPILCLLHVLVGNFIMLNLLVSSIINNYIRIKNKLDGISLMMTAEQQEWKETVTWIRQLKPRTREKAHINPWRNALKNLANSTGFNTAITLTIFANFAVMLSKQHDDSCQTQANMVWVNVGFAVIFAIEAAIKLLGLGLNFYFMDSWNRLDFGLVGLSFVTIALDFASGSHLCTGKAEEAESFPALTALRAIRIVRVFRLIKRFEGLQKMISTLISSLPALVNIISLIALFLFIFAVLGTMLFWNVNQEQDLYGGVDGDGNYGRFDMSFFLLFRQATGETWNAIMFYCSQSDLVLACDDTRTDYQDPIACGSPVLGVAYHILWQAFGTYMLMQLITAVIIQNFEDMVKAEVAVIPEECKNSFVDKWNVFDPDGTSHITVVQLAQLIAEVKPPLGIKSNQFTSSVKVMAVIKDLNIPVRMQEIDRPPEPGSTEPASGTKLVACVRYHDTFIALVRRAHTLLPEDEEEEDLYASPEASSPESESDDDEVGDLYDESQRKSKHPSKRSRLEEASTEDDEGEDGDPSFMFSNPTVAQDYAARQLQHACIAWREKKLQVEKCQDLEVPIPLDRKHALPVLKSPNRTPRPNGAP